jgi:hypothetical protein
MRNFLESYAVVNVCLALATPGCGGALVSPDSGDSGDSGVEAGHELGHDTGVSSTADHEAPLEASVDAPEDLGTVDVAPIEASSPDSDNSSPPPGEDCDSCLTICSDVVEECGDDCQTVIACILAGSTAQYCVCEYPAGGPTYINYTGCFEPQECPGGTGVCDSLCVGTGDYLGCTATGSVPVPSMAMCSGG